MLEPYTETIIAIDIVDGPPSQRGRLVEVEDMRGQSIRIGEWIDRGDGHWALRITLAPVSMAAG